MLPQNTSFIKREPGRNIHRDSFQQIFICWFQSYFFAQHIAEICSCFIYIIFNIAHNIATNITCKSNDYILNIKTFY
ncbi:Uncharacterised protein [Segatella copri]|nr:Uncharacterised protein [Segatella copri]